MRRESYLGGLIEWRRARLRNTAIELAIKEKGEITGESPFALVGSAGAVWIRAKINPAESNSQFDVSDSAQRT